MKKITTILLMLFALSSCTKDNKTEHYTIVFEKPTSESIRVKIRDEHYDFSGTELRKEVDVKWPSSLEVRTDIVGSYNDEIRIALYNNKSKYIGDVKDVGYVSLLATDYEIYYRSTDYSSNGGSNSGSSSHLCGAPTQNGSPCKNKVSGTTGYCWRHR